MMREKLLMSGSDRPTLRGTIAADMPAFLQACLRELTSEDLHQVAGGMAYLVDTPGGATPAGRTGPGIATIVRAAGYRWMP